jgi:hypothetical protein
MFHLAARDRTMSTTDSRTSYGKVGAHRECVRAQGLKPIQIRVPDAGSAPLHRARINAANSILNGLFIGVATSRGEWC